MRYLLILLLPLFLTACPTPVDMVRADGTIVHIDYTDNPCGVRGPWAGCTQVIDGVRHIWRSGVATDDIIKHEDAHPEFQHGDYYLHRYFGNCANITKGAGKYPTGGMVCINDRGRERIIPPGYQDEDCQECRFPSPHKLMGK